MAVKMAEAQVRSEVVRLINEAGSLRGLAWRWECSPAYLSDFVNGRRGPGKLLLSRLGLVMVKTVHYERIEGGRETR